MLPRWVVVVGAVDVAALRVRASPAVPPDPVDDGRDFPDPTALFFDGAFYAYGGHEAMASRDLATWSERWSYLVNGSAPAWAVPGSLAGAPGRPVRRGDGMWLVYFQMPRKGCEARVCSCVGVALAHHPGEPFVSAAAPVVCAEAQTGAIDANPRAFADGELVLYFKSTDDAETGAATGTLWAARLASDGLALAAAPVALVNATAAWEARGGVGCVEAPAPLVAGDGRVRLFYSGGDWTAGLAGLPYSVGYADCEGRFGPCAKAAGPWFGPAYGDVVGPGGQDLFDDADGETWIVFHGWQAGNAGYSHGGRRSARFYPLAALPLS